jgi:hypothetical protein
MPQGERADFIWHSGNDVDLEVTVLDQADAVFSLSGATAVTWQLGRLAKGSVPPQPSQPGRPLITKTLGSGVEFLALVSGLVGATIALLSGDGAPLRGDDYYHEMEVDFGGKHTTTLFGIATVLEDL